MKKIITLLAVTASLAIFTPATVQARDPHNHSQGSGHGGNQQYSSNQGHGGGHGGNQQCTSSRGSSHSSGHGSRQYYRPSYNSGHGSSHGSRGGHITFRGIHIDFGSQRNCR